MASYEDVKRIAALHMREWTPDNADIPSITPVALFANKTANDLAQEHAAYINSDLDAPRSIIEDMGFWLSYSKWAKNMTVKARQEKAVKDFLAKTK